MLRILRAFGWLRSRVLLNSLERHGGRDTLQRFSIAAEQIMPIAAALVMIPSALGIAGITAYTAWSLAHGDSTPGPLPLLRILLLTGCAFALAGPVLLPAGDRTNAVRLLLLPISRRVLYVAQTISTLADPWMLLMTAALAAMPLGFAAAGAGTAAVTAAAAGIVLLLALAGVALLVTNAMRLAVRDRRRGEMLALIALLVLPLLGILPGVFDDGGREPTAGDRVSRSRQAPVWWTVIERRAVAVVPSEMYVAAARAAAERRYGSSARHVGLLIAVTVLLHGAAYAAFTRILGSPSTTGTARGAPGRGLARWRVPGMSAGASAVAINQLKLALRTPRGRASILAPFMLLAVLALVTWRSGAGARLSFIPLGDGLGVAAVACFIALMSNLPLAMNQFAVDRAGLTLMLLSPLDSRTLLAGKAVGNALIVAIPAGGCLLASALLFRSGHPSLWACIPLALLATYLLVAPVAAMLSAIFPRAVDLNSVGQGSNAHGAAGLLGMLGFLAAGAPCLLLVLTATRVLQRPLLAPVLLLAWVGLCVLASRLLFRAAAVVFERRRESLDMVA